MQLDRHQRIGLMAGFSFVLLVVAQRPVYFRLLLRFPGLDRFDLLYLISLMAVIPLGVLVVNLVRRTDHTAGWGLISGGVVLYLALLLIFNDLLLLYLLDPLDQYSFIYLIGLLFTLLIGLMSGIVVGWFTSNRWMISMVAAIITVLWLFTFNLGFRWLVFVPGY